MEKTGSRKGERRFLNTICFDFDCESCVISRQNHLNVVFVTLLVFTLSLSEQKGAKVTLQSKTTGAYTEINQYRPRIYTTAGTRPAALTQFCKTSQAGLVATIPQSMLEITITSN